MSCARYGPVSKRTYVSGETESNISGWTVDTLRLHAAEKLEDAQNALHREIVDLRDYTKQQILDLRESDRIMTTDLRDSVRTQADDHRRMLDERYATQTKALDAAFKAAEQAVAVALANAEKATAKAETAADKRFDAVNEFRQVLTDQTSSFIPRVEYDAAHSTVVDQVATMGNRLAALELRLTSRLDRGEGGQAAVTQSRGEEREERGLARSQIMAVLVALALLVSVASVLINAFHH
jgi:hypothetical protein